MYPTKFFRCVLAIFVCAFISITASGQDFVSVQSGDWDNTDTWGTTGITDDFPAFGDEVLITSNHAITINTLAQAGAMTIEGSASVVLDNTLIVSSLQMVGTSSVTGTNSLSSFGNFSIPSGSVTISGGSISATGISIGSGTLTVGAASLNITGTTAVSGTIVFTSDTGTKELRNVTINSGGTWNNTSTESFTTQNITNNGTWVGCSNSTDCNYTISGNRIISGSNEISIPILTVNSTVTNTGILEITNQLTGTGTFRNGNGVVNGVTLGTLEFNGDGPFSISTVDFSTFSNTVSYTNSGSVTAIATTYRRLTINKSADEVSLGGATRVSGTLTLTDGNLVLGSHNLTISEGASLSTGSTASYIQDSGTGVVRYEVSTTGNDLYVPLGGANFSPITVNLSSASFGGSSSIDFSITDSAHPNRDRDNTGDSPAGDDNGTPATDYLDVYWTISGNNITDPVYTAEYVYDASDFTQTTESNLVPTLYRTLPGGATLDWLALGYVNATNNTASMTRGDGFGDLYAMENSMERLPVSLLSFKAIAGSSLVKLDWKTSKEENNSHFSIERSEDGMRFSEVGTVGGFGTTEEDQSYQFEDKFPLNGRSYYRLRQVDFNGQHSFSEVVSVFYKNNTSGENGIKLSGNYITQGEVIRVETEVGSGKVLWAISDINGKIFSSDHTLQGGEFNIQTNGMYPGMYILRVETPDKQVRSERIIIR